MPVKLIAVGAYYWNKERSGKWRGMYVSTTWLLLDIIKALKDRTEEKN